jgi:opacity protein-like surface antigen
MKRVVLAATMALAMTGVAKADYIDFWGFGGGVSISPDLDVGSGPNKSREMDYGYNMGAFVGWRQSEEISFTADVGFSEREYKGAASSLQALSVMLNANYVCDTGDFWRPFIGAGAGAIEVNFDRSSAGPFLPAGVDPGGSGSEWAFGYQATAGIAFAVDETHAITLGYRYQAAEDINIGPRNVEYASHNISIGVLFD